ncbi:polysaccharide pyruvyl transferase family protein [[Eubacterium] hominis]|uniref:polysaccharide pyruvyl transferase family protein n=1 Tax=[Eubacterium] hominis TaxID=2764325 RepID=UPI0022E4786B
MNKSKLIFVKAYLNKNLGDDLFIDILVNRYPEHKFIILVANKNFSYLSKYENIKVIKLNIVRRVINHLYSHFFKINFFEQFFEKKCDLTVMIGGSLFMQTGEWYANYINLKNNFCKNHNNYLIGCNFGPYYDESYKEKYRKLFELYTDICFRDNYSFSLFKDLKNVRIAPDVVFNYSIPEKDYKTEKSISISIIDPEKKVARKKISLYDEKIIECIEYFCNKKYKVNLLSFCENEGDTDYINKLVSQNDLKNNVNIYEYNGNISEFIDIMNESEYIIATRFHCMILGWLMGKNVYPIIYNEKMKNVIYDVKFKGEFSYLDDLNDFSPENVFLNKDIKIDLYDLKRRASDQFKSLDKYLGGHDE